MQIKLQNAGYRGPFNTIPKNVLVKVKRDAPEFWPWERVLDVYFHVEAYPTDLGGGIYIKSWTDRSDAYMMERFGTTSLRCENTKSALAALEQIIPDWIGKDYSGGLVRDFVFA